MEKLDFFGNRQIQFLESERQIMENSNKELLTNPFEEIMLSHKVIRHVKFSDYNETDKLYSFEYKDLINLIKIGEQVGVFEILKNKW